MAIENKGMKNSSDETIENTEILETDTNPSFGTEVNGSDKDTTGITIMDGQSELNNHDGMETNKLDLERAIYMVRSGHFNL